MTDDGFYEEDEPGEKIRAIFARGQKGVTMPSNAAVPALSVVGSATEAPADSVTVVHPLFLAGFHTMSV